MRSIAVFCGSTSGNRATFAEVARTVGRLLAEQGTRLIYGGGNRGLMGELAQGCLDAGGHVEGVIPDFLQEIEVAHRGLTKLHVVKTMHQRKTKMSKLADAFVALPGGMGTMEELLEIMTWSRLKLHRKPIGILNVDRYFQPLVEMFMQGVHFGFVEARDLELFAVEAQPARLLERLATQALLDVPEPSRTDLT